MRATFCICGAVTVTVCVTPRTTAHFAGVVVLPAGTVIACSLALGRPASVVTTKVVATVLALLSSTVRNPVQLARINADGATVGMLAGGLTIVVHCAPLNVTVFGGAPV